MHGGRALLWEIWRKNRLGNIIALAAIPVFAVLCGIEAHLRGGRMLPDFAPVALVPMLASMLWTFSIFSFTESDSRRGFTGIPGRLFTLPMRTVTIVTWLTIAAALTASGLYVVWAKVVFAFAGFPLPLWFPLAAIATGIVFFQAVVWGLASFPWLRVIVLIAGAFGFVVLNAEGISSGGSWHQSEAMRAFTVLAFLPLAYGAALFGVQAERCGGWHLWAWLRPFVCAVVRLVPRRTASFASCASAQLWFEWRRKGWFLSLALGFGIAGTVVLMPIVVLTDSRAEFSLLIVANALFYPLLMAGVAGLTVAKSDFWSKEIALDSFQALRPATSAELVFAKFKATGLLTLLGCLVAVPLIWWLTRLSNWQDLWNVAELRQKLAQLLPADRTGATVFASVAVLTTIVILWHSMIGSLSTAVTGRKRMINVHVFVGGALFILLVLLIRWLSFHPLTLSRCAPLFYAACASVLMWKLADTIRAFRQVFRQRMASRRAIAILVVLWFLGAASSGALAWMLWNCTAAPQRLLSFALVWLFPNGALAQSIVNLAVNRHR